MLGWATRNDSVVLCTLTYADVSDETGSGSQGLQYVVHFCDTISELVSPPLVKPGDALCLSCAEIPICLRL